MHTQKLVAGALLAGITIAAGETTLIATAGGIGANWLAEGLAGLWPRGTAGPLATAYTTAIRQGVEQAQATYKRTVDPHSDGAPFALVAACAQDVATAEFPDHVTDANTAQAVLGAALDALLYGHDTRQAAYLRQQLLPICAAAFQKQLVADEKAWRAFHGLLLQALAANVLTLGPKLASFHAVLAAFNNPEVDLATLQKELAQLVAAATHTETTLGTTLDGVQRVEAKVDRLANQPQPGGVIFHNQGMNVQGVVHQGKNQYFGSAHAEGGGTAFVVNNIGMPPPVVSEPDPPLTILVLAANPLNMARLRLNAEVSAIDARLRQGAATGRWTLQQQWTVRSGELVDALLRFRPTVLHFAGHGAPDGSLVVEDLAGMAATVPPSALAALLAAVPGVQVVVLNACWSDIQAAALLPHVTGVVGMTHQVTDDAATAFAAGFYRALADGESIATAVAVGKAQILLELDDSGLATAQAELVQLRVREGVDATADTIRRNERLRR
jgi:hypothetical protein